MAKMREEHKTILRTGVGFLNAVLLFLTLTTALEVDLGLLIYLAVTSLAYAMVSILLSLLGEKIIFCKLTLGLSFLILLSDFIFFALEIIPKPLFKVVLISILLLGVLSIFIVIIDYLKSSKSFNFN